MKSVNRLFSYFTSISLALSLILACQTTPVQSQKAASKQPTARTVKFPSDHSLGVLYLLKNNDLERERSIGQAKGTVHLPAGLVCLALSNDNISELDLLRADDLQALDLSLIDVGDKDMSHVVRFTGLVKLDLQDTSVTDKGLAAVCELSKLRELVLRSTKITGAGLTALSKLKELECLQLAGNRLTSWPDIKSSKLFRLGLDQNKTLTDQGLGPLPASLGHLGLSGTGISDKTIERLPELDALVDLTIANTRVTSRCLPSLTRIKHLNYLDIAGTSITDKDLPLTQLKGLRLLSMRESQISNLNKLQQALPACEVDVKPR